MDVPLALKDIEIRKGYRDIGRSPQRSVTKLSLMDFLRFLMVSDDRNGMIVDLLLISK